MEQVEVTPKTIDPIEVYRRNIEKMPDRVMRSYLRKKARQKGSIDGVWATILSTIFESKAAPFLR